MADSKFSYRRAEPGDYQAVMDIGKNIYAGTDYMPSMYFKYLDDPNRRLYVAFKGDKLVAFAMNFIVDGGQTMIGQAGRAVPGSNVFRWFRRLPFYDECRINNKLKHAAFTSFEKDLHLKKIRKGTSSKNFILTRPRIEYFPTAVEENRISKMTVPSPIGEVALVNKSLAHKIISDVRNQWKLFPQGRILITWEPFRLMKSNFDYILNDLEMLTVVCTFPSKEPRPLCETISFGHVFKCPGGLRYDVEYYGTSTKDAAAHVQKHITQIEKFREPTDNKGTIFDLFIPAVVGFSEMRNELENTFNIKLPTSLNMHCSLFEEDVNVEEQKSKL